MAQAKFDKLSMDVVYSNSTETFPKGLVVVLTKPAEASSSPRRHQT